MEVFGITVFFIALVACATAVAGYLVGRALRQDREYMLASGEMQLVAVAAAIEPEPPPLAAPVDPVGTLAILLVYLMVLIGLWLAMFAILLERS